MKGKILEIETTGKSWEGSHGTMWTYFVQIQTMDDKTFRGEANSKSENINDLPYKIEDEVEFEHTESQGEYPDKLKIQKEGQSQYSGNKAKGNNRSFALSYAKDLAVARIASSGLANDTEVIIKQADAFVKWLDN